jgi:uncharacterized protein involved in exopolysaccharide biosynthesis
MARDILSASSERSLVSRASDIFRRRMIVVLLVFAAVVASAVAFALYLPDLYRTSATVLVERPVPETYVRSAVSGEVESRMHVIKQEVLSRGAAHRADRALQPLSRTAQPRADGHGARPDAP